MSTPTSDGSLATADVRLFETGNFADAIIVCGDSTWKVHKALLSSRCKWFERAFFGKLAEAASGKIVLEEQDPDLIGIMLRFIYSRDIDIAKLGNGKGIPALCVKLYRVADFFLLKELQSKVMTGLRVHLDNLLAIPDSGDIRETPARMLEVEEVFESVKEVYKDNSGESLREMLLGFLWMRNGKVFQTPELALLLSEIPDLGKDLMLTYISGEGTAVLHDKSKAPTGLLVLEAVCAPDFFYRAGDKKLNMKGASKAPCLLRHTPGCPSSFKPVDAETGAIIEELDWITPPTSQIIHMTSNETSDIVFFTMRPSRTKTKKLWLRFKTPGDAKYYTKCYGAADDNITSYESTKASLQKVMSGIISRIDEGAQS